jgi:4-carboxymuconolactone decarboxylase
MEAPMTIPPAARIAPISAPYPPAVAERLARLLPPGMAPPQLFLSVARNEGLFVQMVDAGLLGPTGLWDRRALPRALRESVILRTCVACRNDYEFNLHVQTISARMGLSEAQIDDLRRASPDPALWDEATLAVLAMVDALVARRALDDAEYTRLHAHHDDATLIEITQLVGFYVGVAMLVGLVRPAFDRYRAGAPLRATAEG